MDVLSDVLRAVRLTGAIFFDVEVSAPWVAMTPEAFSIHGNVMPEAEHLVLFHAITSGECWVEFLDGSVPSLRAEAGDIVVVPMGDAHLLCSTPGMRTQPDLEAYRRPKDRSLPIVISRGGQGQDQARFVCGYLGFDARPFNPVLHALPRISHPGGGWRRLYAATDQARGRREHDTTLGRRDGSVQGGRTHVRRGGAAPHRYAADGRSKLVGRPARRACECGAASHARKSSRALDAGNTGAGVGLSRSAFADRFAHFVHDSPMQYLTRWRMQLATHLLDRQGVGLAQVAAEVGYESEAAFNRAFKKCVGVPPGAWRRTHLSMRPQ